jgi:hypothetical protein
MTDSLLRDLLHAPVSAITHAACERLTAMRPDRHVLETEDPLFDPMAYARAKALPLRERAEAFSEWTREWRGADRVSKTLRSGWVELDHEGRTIELVRLVYGGEGFNNPRSMYFVIAEDEAIARAYFTEVCTYNAEVRDEILVYANGCWNKSGDLFTAVRRTSFADVVLAPGLAESIRDDFDQFVAARDRYAAWGIPWKRGALLLGPPGNGKTMCIKALLSHLRLPCLYVQSFVAPQLPEQVAIREVFTRARHTAPCVMVLEDLDSLVSPAGRSFFLNELDGFAANEGMIVIGSTNHPERLDPAIVDRPSRFDRKYHFDLPAETERRRYVAWWNARFAETLRLDDDAVDSIARGTEGFSFAYLKELFAAALMRFASAGDRSLVAVLSEETATLRAQMSTAQLIPDVVEATVPEDPHARGRASYLRQRREQHR